MKLSPPCTRGSLMQRIFPGSDFERCKPVKNSQEKPFVFKGFTTGKAGLHQALGSHLQTSAHAKPRLTVVKARRLEIKEIKHGECHA